MAAFSPGQRVNGFSFDGVKKTVVPHLVAELVVGLHKDLGLRAVRVCVAVCILEAVRIRMVFIKDAFQRPSRSCVGIFVVSVDAGDICDARFAIILIIVCLCFHLVCVWEGCAVAPGAVMGRAVYAASVLRVGIMLRLYGGLGQQEVAVTIIIARVSSTLSLPVATVPVLITESILLTLGHRRSSATWGEAEFSGLDLLPQFAAEVSAL